MKQFAVALCAAGLAVSAPALAQDADPMEHYAAYNAAIDAGDYATASREGEAAWRAAESAWGEEGDTGTLAYNIAQMRVATGDRAGAQEPAARAVELAELSDGYTQGEARLLYGISLATSNPTQAKGHLEAGVGALESAGVESDELIRGRLDLAMLSLDNPEAAQAMAQAAVDQSRGSESPNLALDLADLGKIQYLAGNYAAASMTLGEAMGLWPAQEPGQIPQPLATTWAWHTIAGRANEIQNGVGQFGPFNPRAIPWMFLGQRGCNIQWRNDEAVDFPAPQSSEVKLGASITMYDLNEDGQPVNIRTIASAPAEPHHQDFIRQQLERLEARRVPDGCAVGHFLPLYYEY